MRERERFYLIIATELNHLETKLCIFPTKILCTVSKLVLIYYSAATMPYKGMANF